MDIIGTVLVDLDLGPSTDQLSKTRRFKTT